MGILLCGTGIGMEIVANKFRGVRAALIGEANAARITRRHNDSNVLCLGGKMIGREHFFLRVALQDSKSVILNSFVKQYYAGTPFVPKELMLETDIEDHELV